MLSKPPGFGWKSDGEWDQSVAPTLRSSAITGALGSQILSNSAMTASVSAAGDLPDRDRRVA